MGEEGQLKVPAKKPCLSIKNLNRINRGGQQIFEILPVILQNHFIHIHHRRNLLFLRPVLSKFTGLHLRLFENLKFHDIIFVLVFH